MHACSICTCNITACIYMYVHGLFINVIMMCCLLLITKYGSTLYIGMTIIYLAIAVSGSIIHVGD